MNTYDTSSYQDPLSLSEICEYNRFEDITHKYEGEIVEVEFDHLHYHPDPNYKNRKKIVGLVCREVVSNDGGYYIGVSVNKDEPPTFIRVSKIHSIKRADINDRTLFKLGNDL